MSMDSSISEMILAKDQRIAELEAENKGLYEHIGFIQSDDFMPWLDSLKNQLAEAQREIDVLRIYGNKDCTAMADEVLQAKNKEDGSAK